MKLNALSLFVALLLWDIVNNSNSRGVQASYPALRLIFHYSVSCGAVQRSLEVLSASLTSWLTLPDRSVILGCHSVIRQHNAVSEESLQFSLFAEVDRRSCNAFSHYTENICAAVLSSLLWLYWMLRTVLQFSGSLPSTEYVCVAVLSSLQSLYWILLCCSSKAASHHYTEYFCVAVLRQSPITILNTFVF